MAQVTEDELASFRLEWQRELQRQRLAEAHPDIPAELDAVLAHIPVHLLPGDVSPSSALQPHVPLVGLAEKHAAAQHPGGTASAHTPTATSTRDVSAAKVVSASSATSSSLDNTSAVNLQQAEDAASFFKQAVAMERSGRVYEAIPLYKKAFQINPDIDRAYSAVDDSPSASVPNPTRPSAQNNAQSHHPHEHATQDHNRQFPANDDGEGGDSPHGGSLYTSLLDGGHVVVQPQRAPRGCHIGLLPFELLCAILRHLADELDMTSVDRASATCRGMYVVARDASLWRVASMRVWGDGRGSLAAYGGSWRRMFLSRPRIRIDGVYISAAWYVRQGERGLDSYYQPIHRVDYYRYLRFFSDGTVLSLNTPDEPRGVVPRLRTKVRTAADATSAILEGTYWLEASEGVLVVELRKKSTSRSDAHDSTTMRGRRGQAAATTSHESAVETVFRMELGVRGAREGGCTRLEWIKYESVARYPSGSSSVNEFDLNSQFQPYRFSKVKSYMASRMPQLQPAL